MKLINLFDHIIIAMIVIIPIMMVSGCFGPPGRDDGEDVRFTFIVDMVVSRDQDNETVWDAFISIDEIDPYDMEYKWNSITIMGREGSSLEISPTTPRKYESGPGRFGNIDVWFDDISGNPESADPIDQIVITSLPEEYQGLLIILSYKGDQSGSIPLPDDFPYP